MDSTGSKFHHMLLGGQVVDRVQAENFALERQWQLMNMAMEG